LHLPAGPTPGNSHRPSSRSSCGEPPTLVSDSGAEVGRQAAWSSRTSESSPLTLYGTGSGGGRFGCATWEEEGTELLGVELLVLGWESTWVW
jgi:hypothetical protein